MVTSPIPLSRSLLRQKNIWLTAFAFVMGLFLQLTDTTLILIVLGIALLSSWWYWHPSTPNVESQMILDALKRYPAVTIRNYRHIIAFRSTPPTLAAAYRSPVPFNVLKQKFQHIASEIEGVELSLSRAGLEVFILLKVFLTPQTEIKNIFQIFQNIIALFELYIQNTFSPAERYHTLRLFGLEHYLDNIDQETKTIREPMVKHSPNRFSLSSQKLKRAPLLIDS